MRKLYFFFIALLLGCILSFSTGETEDINGEENPIMIYCLLPDIDKSDLDKYIKRIIYRVEFFSGKKAVYGSVDNILYFDVSALKLKELELNMFQNCLSKNVYVQFHEVLRADSGELEQANYVFFKNDSKLNKAEILPIKKNGLLLTQEDMSDIKIISEASQKDRILFTLNKEGELFKDFRELMNSIRKSGFGFTRLFVSCSGVLTTAPIVLESLEDKFVIYFQKGKEVENKLVEMQVRFPLPFEVYPF